jgi:hypothetical protein
LTGQFQYGQHIHFTIFDYGKNPSHRILHSRIHHLRSLPLRNASYSQA